MFDLELQAAKTLRTCLRVGGGPRAATIEVPGEALGILLVAVDRLRASEVGVTEIDHVTRTLAMLTGDPMADPDTVRVSLDRGVVTAEDTGSVITAGALARQLLADTRR